MYMNTTTPCDTNGLLNVIYACPGRGSHDTEDAAQPTCHGEAVAGPPLHCNIT